MEKNILSGYLGLVKETILNLPRVSWNEQFLPLSIVATLHALRVALTCRYVYAPNKSILPGESVPWLQALIVNLLMGLGGGVLSSIVFGRYVPWLASNTVVPLYTAIHFLIFYSPSDLAFHFTNTLLPALNPLLVIADGISRANAVFSTIDYLRTSTPEPLATSYVAMILGGTVAACGGGILMDLFNLGQLDWRFQTPNFAKQLPLAIRTPFYLAITYILATTPSLPFNNLLSDALIHIPFLHRLENLLTHLGSFEPTDFQVLLCIAFSAVLLYEEYYINPMFNFNIKPQVQVNGVNDSSTSQQLENLLKKADKSFSSKFPRESQPSTPMRTVTPPATD